jgi:hypothetical protein
MLDLLLARQGAARSFKAPPGLPDEREAMHRQAFDDRCALPDF